MNILSIIWNYMLYVIVDQIWIGKFLLPFKFLRNDSWCYKTYFTEILEMIRGKKRKFECYCLKCNWDKKEAQEFKK